MASLVYTDVGVYVDKYDFSGVMNEADVEVKVDTKDATVFRQTTRVYKPGVLDAALDLKGFVDFAAGDDAQDAVMFNGIGLSTPIVSILPEGSELGDRAFFGQFAYATYAPGAKHGDLLAFSLKASGRTELTRGKVMNNALVAVTGNGATAKIQVGAIPSGGHAYAQLHVVSHSGDGNLVVKVQSDANSGAGGETDRMTFATATDETSERLSLAGAITDAWWRLNYTFTGTSCLFLVTFGIGD